MHEFLAWIERSIFYLAALAGLGTLALLAMRVLA
jgi:hypothetical protein